MHMHIFNTIDLIDIYVYMYVHDLSFWMGNCLTISLLLSLWWKKQFLSFDYFWQKMFQLFYYMYTIICTQEVLLCMQL